MGQITSAATGSAATRSAAKGPLAGAALLLLLLAACVPAAREFTVGGSGPGPCPDTIEIRGFAYFPPRCTAEAGATLTFVNRGSTAHSATTTDEAAAGFDTGLMQPGGSATVTLGGPGDYPYFCRLHPGMQAIIRVDGAAGSPGEEAAPPAND